MKHKHKNLLEFLNENINEKTLIRHLIFGIVDFQYKFDKSNNCIISTKGEEVFLYNNIEYIEFTENMQFCQLSYLSGNSIKINDVAWIPINNIYVVDVKNSNTHKISISVDKFKQPSDHLIGEHLNIVPNFCKEPQNFNQRQTCSQKDNTY